MENWILPEGWEWKTIDDLFDLQQGVSMSPRRRRGENPVPFLRTKNILWGDIDLQEVDEMDVSDNELERLKLKDGDLLICEGGDVGRTAVWEGQLPIVVYQNHIHRLRRKNDKVEPKFYMYWMQAAYQVFNLYYGEESRTAIPNLSGGRLKSFTVPYVEITQQRRIVARLEALLSEVRAMRDLLQSMRRDWAALIESALAEVFPSHGQALPEGWEWVKVDKVANDTTRRNPESEPDKPFQYIDIAAVDNQEFTIVPERVKTLLGQDAPSRARKVIHAQNIILATTRPYLKNIALVTEQFDNQICSTGFCVLCPISEKIDYRYLYHAVKADLFIKQLIPLQRGANYPAVSDSDVFACEIPLPYPDDPAHSLAEQRRIVAYLEAVQEEVSAARRQVEEDERRVTQLEQSILAAAFRGEV